MPSDDEEEDDALSSLDVDPVDVDDKLSPSLISSGATHDDPRESTTVKLSLSSSFN